MEPFDFFNVVIKWELLLKPQEIAISVIDLSVDNSSCSAKLIRALITYSLKENPIISLKTFEETSSYLV